MGDLPRCENSHIGRNVSDMTLATAFWIVYLVLLLICVCLTWPAAPGLYRPFVSTIMFFVLIGMLGWGIFGGAIKR